MEPINKYVDDIAQTYAKAWKEDIETYIKREGEPPIPAWDEMKEPQRDAMRRCSKHAMCAIVKQMREPSEAMISAARDEWGKMHSFPGQVPGLGWETRYWRAMLDAYVKESGLE